MRASTKNVTFSLPIELIEKLKNFANSHYIPSVSAGVREALEGYIRGLDKEMLKKKMKEASEDPLFMQDLDESMNAFEHSDKETFGGVGEW